MAPGARVRLEPPCSNLTSSGRKCTVLKTVLVTLLGLFGARGIVPPFPPSLRPCAQRSPKSWANVETLKTQGYEDLIGMKFGGRHVSKFCGSTNIQVLWKWQHTSAVHCYEIETVIYTRSTNTRNQTMKCKRNVRLWCRKSFNHAFADHQPRNYDI